MAGTYTKTAYADLQNGDVVIITELVGTNVYAASNDNGTSAAPTAVSVTVANDAITTDATNILWTVVKDGANISFKTGDNYLYCTNTNNGMRVGSNSNNVFSIDANSGYLYNNGTSRFIGVYNSSDWRCYTTVNANIKDQTLAFYAVGGSTPSESVVANFCHTEVGHMMEATPAQDSYVLLSIGSKGGKTIVRIDQDAAKNTAMFDYLQVTGIGSVGADVAEGGVTAMAYEFDTPAAVNDSLTLEVLWSTVNWAGRWMVQNIRVAVADCQYAVVPLVPITCAEVYNMAKNDEVLLNDVTVTFANGKNVWVKDATGSMLVYLPDNGSFAAGDVLSGVEGVVDIYNGVTEVKPSAAQVAAIDVTAGEAPAPEELTAVAASDVNKYIVIKNLAVEGEFVEGTASNITLTLADESTIVLRSNFKNAYAFDAAKTYNITAVVTIYQSNPQLYFISAEEYVAPVVPADRRINAWGLNSVANGDDYAFSYYANIAGEEANLLFYKDGVLQGRVAVDAPKQGVNDVTLAKSEIPQGTGLTWAVELKANPVVEFAKIYEDTENVLQRAHSAVDNSPESDYMGRVYVENRTGTAGEGGIYVYNPDYTIHTANTKCGLPSFRSAGRPDVASDGTLWMADWGDGGANAGFGIASVNPQTLVATPFFNGTQANNGLWTNASGVEMGSSCAGVGLFGEGENMKLYAMNEDGQVLPSHGCVVYNIGQEGGSILKTWDQAPSATWTLTGNAAQNLEVTPTSHGVFFSCNRSEGQNTSSARALQLVKDGTKIFEGTPGDEGTMPQLTGCSGGGVALSRDEDRMYIVNGAGNILVYNVAWTNDVPTMTYVTTYETTFNAIGTMDLDYAGNLIVSAGSAYGTAMRLVVYAIPTDNNKIIVPAKKALVVEGTDPNPTTAIEDIYVMEVQKVIRNGQVLIIKDGKTYNMMGQIVE